MIKYNFILVYMSIKDYLMTDDGWKTFERNLKMNSELLRLTLMDIFLFLFEANYPLRYLRHYTTECGPVKNTDPNI